MIANETALETKYTKFVEGDIYMGRDNNNAGIHMIHFKKSEFKDDSRYYDQLIAERYKRNVALKKEIESSIESKPIVVEKNNIDPKQNSNSKCKKKEKLSKRNYIIDEKHLNNTNLVLTNVMIMALKSNLNIHKILIDTEKLMNRDSRFNGDLTFDENPFPCVQMNKMMVYLNILAEKLNCSVQELFIDDEESRRNFVYELLDQIPDYIWDDDSDEDDDWELNASFCIPHYNPDAPILETFGTYYNTLIIRKITDETSFYTFSCVDYAPLYYSEHYLMRQACIWHEKEGKLKEKVEHLIKTSVRD